MDIMSGMKRTGYCGELSLEDIGKEVVLITSEFLGKGNDDLGKILMKGFIYTLSETVPYPSKSCLLTVQLSFPLKILKLRKI